MRISALLCLFALVSFNSLTAQEKPTWTTTPGSLYQQNKSYPSPLEVRLFFNKCYGNDGKVIAPLKQADGYTIVVTGTGVTASDPTVGDCALTTKLTIAPGAQAGMQMLTVRKGGADDGFALFDFMDATAGPTPSTPEVDVLWEVLTDHLCRDNFGNHMPKDLYCIEAKIGNNSSHSLQIAAVGFFRNSPACTTKKTPCTQDPEMGISTPNVSYQTARASAQAGQSTTARNIIVNGTQALGMVMASFTPFFKNPVNTFKWLTGATIVGTTLSQAISIVAPDQTLREINNLDDQAFRDGKLIPNNTQVRFLVFVQKRSLAEAIGEIVPQIQDANEILCSSPIPMGYKNISGQSGKCYPAWEDSLKSCIRNLDCDPLVVKLALGKMIIVGDKIDSLLSG